MKSLFQTRTFWWNALSALSLILLLPELQTMLGPNAIKIVLLVNAIVNIILRYLTTTPVKSLTNPAKIASLLLVLALSAGGCQKPPPNLTPAGTAAFKGTQVIKSLDTLRDAAVDANAQVPPLLSTETTRKVVLYHKTAITAIHSAPEGWKPSVQSGLIELETNLSALEKPQLVPYVTLVRTLINEVTR